MGLVAETGGQRARSLAAMLLVLGDGLRARDVARGPSSDLHRSIDLGSGFGFLVGVIADFGIPASSAWRLPRMLAARLGHLDPERVAAGPSEVAGAFTSAPMLHRFPLVTAAWTCGAANRVSTTYGGDTRRIWSDHPTAAALRSRLTDFAGIGQKKAAMAVELLTQLGVEVDALGGSDVAYDIHVRRVFLRAGLAEGDSPAAITAAARALVPTRPGALDLGAWHVGRSWCRPRDPACGQCPLAYACLQRVRAADTVRAI